MSMYGYDMPGSQGPTSEPQPSASVTPGSQGLPAADPTAVFGRRTVAWLIDAVLLLVIGFFFSFVGPFAEYEDIAEVREEVPALADLPNDQACDLIKQEVDDVTCVVPPDAFSPVLGEDRAYYVRNEIALLGVLAGLAWFVLVYVIWQGATGATPGKAIMKVRVVDEDGAPPGLGRSLGRSVMWVVDGQPFGVPAVGFVTGLTSTGHRRVGDMAAKTYVVGVDSTGKKVTLPEVQTSPAMPPPPPGTGPVGASFPSVPPSQAGPTAPPTSATTFTPPPAAPTTAPAPPTPSGEQPAQASAPAPPTPSGEQPAQASAPAPPTPSGEQPAQAPNPPSEAPPPAPAPAPAAPTDSPSSFAPPAAPEPEPSETREPEPSPVPDPEPSPATEAAPPTEPRPAPPTQAEPEPQAEPLTQDEAPTTPEPQPEPQAAQPAPQSQPVYQPQWDEARGTYIQWDPNRSRWLQWDDNAKEWQAI